MTPTITVLHSHPVWLGNTMTWLYNEVRDLPPEIESHIVCHRTENLDQFSIPNIHSLEDLSQWRRGLDRALRRLRLRRHLGLLTEVARKTGARILHSHFGNVGYADRGAARARGLRQVVSFYGRDVSLLPRRRPVWTRRYRVLFESADRILSMGDHMTAALRALGCPEERIRVHHLGVHTEHYPFIPREWDPGEGRPLRILLAAMFREKKGLPFGIEACGIAARHGAPIEVTVIGDATGSREDQAEKLKIMAAVAHCRIEGRIRFLGIQTYESLMRHAYAHHIFVSPSVTAQDGDDEGGVALPVIEMAATGMPVVATIHADTPGVIVHGETGLLAPERDAEALAKQILYLHDHRERWRPILAAARRRIEDEFDAREQGRRLAAIYREVLER